MAIIPNYRTMVTFDRSIIKRNWKAINEGPLKRAGLLARRIERQSIRVDITKKQNPSRPPRPPKSRHPGHPFRLIYSVPNPMDTSVIIGHVGFYAGQTAMQMHEFGEQVRISTVVPRKRKWQIKDPVKREKVAAAFRSGKLKRPKPQPRTTKVIQMPERPFALPALQKTAKRLPQLWVNSVGSATVRK